jgi:phage terminase large subunit-like protein
VKKSAHNQAALDGMWRPRSRAGPPCGYSFRGATCSRRGAHHCVPRADRACFFFAEVLVHTKGRFARQAFVLDGWQEWEIVRPLFGEVVWSPEWGCYIRRFRVAYICVARKNGKSELAAGIVLFLLVADDEEAAEVYGAAKDTKQAGKVGEVVVRMMQLSPVLSARLKYNKNNRRVYDVRTASYYEVIPSDAEGELGANPHGAVIDEVLSQPDGSLWDALRTATGTRTQPLMLLVTTETNEPESFGASTIDEAERIQADPRRQPEAFAFVRKTPLEADPWDEKGWAWANPALGSFLSVAALRMEALEALNEPAKENAFRQFRLNQRQQQASRWMPMVAYDACGGMASAEPSLAGRLAHGGLDLSATSDLTALAWWLPGRGEGEPAEVLWRFWVPEAQVDWLDRRTSGRFGLWVREGFVRATEGDVVDYEAVHRQIQADAALLDVRSIGLDRWNAQATSNWLEEQGLPRRIVPQTYAGTSGALKELMRLTQDRAWQHGGNPVARWCFDAVEVKRDDRENIRTKKPDRAKDGRRIDAVDAVVMALEGCQSYTVEEEPPQRSRRPVSF